MTPTVGFVGLGIMGAPMARNLLDAGYTVVGYNRSPGKVEAFVEDGGLGADSAREVGERCDVAVTCLPDTETVEAVVLGEGGVAAGMDRGSVIDCSTVSPPAAERIAADLEERGIDFLDAPVSGGESGAVEASLSIMVGGPAETVEAHRDLLSALGSTVTHCGEAGAGQYVKAVNQLIVSGFIEVVAEGLVLGAAAGVDLEAAYDAISDGACRSYVVDYHARQMLDGDFEPGAPAEHVAKDLGYVADAADAHGAPIPTTTVTKELFESLIERGGARMENSAVVTVLEALAGDVEARSTP